MSKRKYSSSSSDDCDLDDDDSVFSSSSREREELKALFCNYIDRLSKRRKATKKRKVFTELVQSFSELPFLAKKKTKAKARKNIHKYHQRADSSNDEKAVLQKNNLRNFFEGRISKLCQAHATTFDFKSNPSDSSDSLNSWKIDNKERIDNLKSQSSKLILKEKLSNRKKWELVKKWKNEHFEKPSAEDISEDLTSKALHKHVAKDIINSSKFSSSSSLLLSPLTSKTNVQEASKSHDDHSSNMKVFVSFQTHPTDSNNTILLERNSSEKSTPVLKNMESLDIMNSKQSCQNSQVDKMHTLESDVNETHNQPSGVDEESSKNSPSKESSAMKLDSKLKGMPNSEECLVEEAEDFDTPTYIESKEKKAKNKKAKSKHKTRHKTKSSRDGDVKKISEKSQSKKLDKMSKSKSTKASRSRSQEARLKLERNCHHTGRVSRSNSRLENSKSRSRERQTRVEKARNQLEVHASKYSRHKEDHKDYESHYRDEERHEKRGKARPNVKRVRNFLSLDSSVEEVFSNNENTDNQGRVNSSIHDSSSSSEASSRVEVGKTIHSRWSQSSESDLSKASSTWQVDVEKQKPIQRRHDSKGKYEFKRKSSTKIRERLRQPRAAESSADETDEKKIVSGSSRTKHPKVAIDLQDLFSLEVGSERKNCKESKNNKEHKMVSECKSKSDDMTKGSKGSISTDADKASLDLGVSHSVYISSVPSLKENAFNQETEKTQVNTSSTICQNIGKDQVELSSLGRAPLRISFKPRAVLKNVNKLAEASIKFASSKFNSLYMKKSTKNDDNFENKLSTSGSKTPPTKMIIGSPLSTGVHKIMSGEKRSDRSTVSKENEARAEKRVVLNRQSNKQENGNDHRKNHSLRKEDEKSRRIRSSCESTHSARSSRSTERKKSISRRRIRSSSSSRRSYSSRSRGRSWRRGRSRTYSSRRSYRSRSRSNSRRRSRRLGRFRRDGRSTYSSRDSSRRNYNSRSRSRSRRRRRTYSSRSSSRGGCRRLRSYRDWSSFSSRVTSRSRSSRTYSRSGSRRRNRLSERKYIGSGKKRSPSDSPRRTSSESLTADSDASSKDGDAEKSTKEGNLVYECGDILHDRYEILSTLGTGTFSKVVQCVDLKSDKHVALKIIKNIPKYREAAELEISILKDIAAKDPNDENFCIRMHSTFEHLDHWCLVFDSMGLNLYEFLKNNSYQPYMMEQIRHVGFQLVKAVKFLHGIGLMHTDLKPENVLFVNSDFSATTSTNKGKKFYHELRHTDIRLIDFGSAVYDHETHEDVVSTRQYRAVEVILGIGWNRSCDVWSVGCILFEMYAGHTLFQTHSNLEHLVMMEAILGPLPSRMIRKTEKNYFSGGRLKWDSSSREGRCIKKNCKPFKNYMLRGEMDHQDLFELMLLMLTYEPQDRITAEKALEDRFFARLSGRR